VHQAQKEIERQKIRIRGDGVDESVAQQRLFVRGAQFAATATLARL
jgi:hypothetical protein